jgi:hypothetical protein
LPRHQIDAFASAKEMQIFIGTQQS